ncbi:cyclin-dependent kinase inhibitor 1D [Brachyhypopomus gauderio]|uniref:cyclin-dependent kinase inhibitor 1D n=1 Tax=Brachyhypopomus gauderio TaxID=698409 RepID=UPI00404113D2
MAVTSSQCDHAELEGPEEDGKPPAAAVRRSLFGPVDHVQLHQDFQKLLGKSVEVAKQRWNFDFQRDRPVPGPMEWEELPCQDVPAFYRSCVVRAGAAQRRLEPAGDAGEASGCSSAATDGEEYLEVRARGVYRGTRLEKREPAPLGLKRRQATIPDFFAVKKRKFLHQKESRQ